MLFCGGRAKRDLAGIHVHPSRTDTNVGSNYVGGTSMHPLDDVRLGEQLVKNVYELIRSFSPALWTDTMLIITFDEHGGFFDHVSCRANHADRRRY